MTKPIDADAPLIRELETAIRKVLKEDGVETPDRIKAIEAGTRLLAVKHKIKDGDSKENFFGGGAK